MIKLDGIQIFLRFLVAMVGLPLMVYGITQLGASLIWAIAIVLVFIGLIMFINYIDTGSLIK